MKKNNKFIYPECPVCEDVNDGVRLENMRTGMFLYKCQSCDSRSEGYYSPEKHKVYWTKINISFLKWIGMKIFYRW